MRSRRLILALMLVAATALPAYAQGKKRDKADKQKKGATTLGNVAESQKDPAREKLDGAIRLIKSESYGAAAAQLHELLESESSVTEEAEYNLAKALYRLGLYHSSLYYYTSLLARGPKSRYHSAALEWCLFISRKIVADDRVHESVARYASGDFPKEYRDEFLFHLGRFHYSRALAIEAGEVAGALGETRVKETVTGGKSFGGDIFGDMEGGETETAPEDDTKVTKKEGGGLSLDEDIFGDAPAKGLEDDKKKKGKEKKAEPAKSEPAPGDEPKKRGPDEKFVLTAKEHVEQAARFVTQVNGESRFGPRAKFLEALVLYKQGRDNDALESFKSVIRLTRSGTGTPDERLRELAFFQLARTHFGANQPSYSIFYYDKIDRDSYAWLEAIYESSWAEFRLGNFEKALGNLLTLHSPFFKDEYYPESHILKAVIYYENCRYPEAKEFLTEFQKKYEPVHDELAKLTQKDQPPAKYYEILSNLRGNDLAESNADRSKTLSQILQIALADRELRHLDESYREVDDELKKVAATPELSGARLGTHLNNVLGEEREGLAREAGRAVKRTLEKERYAIKQLIEQSVRIDIETARAEQERIEGKLRNEMSEPKSNAAQFVEWANDERLVWPFTGEYWRDELGTYELTLAHSCQTQAGRSE